MVFDESHKLIDAARQMYKMCIRDRLLKDSRYLAYEDFFSTKEPIFIINTCSLVEKKSS